jgi:hypothetical protein
MEEVIDAYHGNVAHDVHDATSSSKTLNGVIFQVYLDF